MILAHVLVAIDYYAKCPNLKKPDSLSSTNSNATHYSKIHKKVFAKSVKNVTNTNQVNEIKLHPYFIEKMQRYYISCDSLILCKEN